MLQKLQEKELRQCLSRQRLPCGGRWLCPSSSKFTIPNIQQLIPGMRREADTKATIESLKPLRYPNGR